MSRRWLLCLLFVVCAPACRGQADQTGIVVDLSSEFAAPAEIDRLRVVVTAVDSARRHEDEFKLDGPGAQHLPASMLVVPASGSSGRVRIEATALLGDRPIVSRSASLAFQAGQLVHVALPLRKVCGGKSCPDPGSTCDDDGACASDGLAGSQPGPTGDGAAPDAPAGPTRDGALPDGGAPVDAAREGADGPALPDGGAPDQALPRDSPPPDSGSPGPEDSRCPPGALLCDGFERPVFNENNPWSPYVDPGGPALVAKTLIIDTRQARRGVASLRFHVDKGMHLAAGFHWTFGAHDRLYVRYFVYFPASPAGTGSLTFDGFTDQTDTEWSPNDVHLESAPPDILSNAGTLINRGLPTGRWVCVLSAIDLVAKQVWISVDDQRSVTAALARVPRTSRVQFRFEADLTASAQSYDMWIDEVVVSESMLTCGD
jgi:hypothetical protein